MPPSVGKFDRQCKAEGCLEIIPASADPRRRYCGEGCRRRQTTRDHDRRKRFGAFGAEISDYDRLLLAQEGRCAICGSQSPGGRKGLTRFAFDHDHETSRARGLLCYLCNVGLGSFQDDPALLQAAIRYLDAHTPGTAINPRPGATAEAVTPLSEKVS